MFDYNGTESVKNNLNELQLAEVIAQCNANSYCCPVSRIRRLQQKNLGLRFKKLSLKISSFTYKKLTDVCRGHKESAAKFQ